MGDRLLAGLKRRLDGEATPRPAKRSKTPSESSGASSKQTEYVPGPSVPAYADGIYTWNYGRSAIDEAAAANAVGETPQACCWIMAAVGKLPPEPQVLCPFFGKKDHRGIDHSTMSSTVHVHTIAKRQDDDWRRKVSRVATRTRPKSTVEAGNDKSQSQSLTGDGPTAMLRPLLTLVELYAGIGSMSQAASCLGIAAELQAFTELPTPAADYLTTVHGAPNLGPTEHADYTGLNPVITTVTCECTPFTESGLQRFADDPRSAQILQSAEAILALRPRILINENVRHFYSMNDNPRHGLFTAFKAALAPAMVTMPVQFVQDSQVGGTLYRTRGMLLAERADFAASLPQWGITIASKMPVCPITLLAPLHTIPTSSYLLGTYEQTHLVKEATGSTSPMQVGRLWWGDSNTPLQAGVIVWWRGARYKVDNKPKQVLKGMRPSANPKYGEVAQRRGCRPLRQAHHGRPCQLCHSRIRQLPGLYHTLLALQNENHSDRRRRHIRGMGQRMLRRPCSSKAGLVTMMGGTSAIMGEIYVTPLMIAKPG